MCGLMTLPALWWMQRGTKMAKPIIIYIGSVTVYAEYPKCRHKLQFYKD